ncbi:hypothetical protein PIB30_061911 [Stylosanthes scabra]|uniref:Uncharacterized protein n=1 Tax=Stylosanthes scabra TaxID=79078 RepID=A0ABU6YJU6_9FABA|nr:hypothetical protein [Stylosanthes scabra]
MENEGFKPNEVTLLAVFSACSHGGLGCYMKAEAHKLMESLPIKSDATAWRVKHVLSSFYTEHPTDSLLISGTYAAAGEMKQTKAAIVELEGGNMLKEAGVSIVEIDNHG